MARNYMADIAKMLGVELGEKFKIKGYEAYTCKLDNQGLKSIYGNDTKMSAVNDDVLVSLLSGANEIVKLPRKPEMGEIYFSFGLSNGKWIVGLSWWGGIPYEYALLEKGWVFKTRAEAEATLPDVAKKLGMEYTL